jgi:hypothetical protein
MGEEMEELNTSRTQSGRQAAQRRAIQQRRTEERIRSLRLRLLSAADASATAGRLTEAFADRDRWPPPTTRRPYSARQPA